LQPQPGTGLPEIDDEGIQEMWDFIDPNHNGEIEEEELAAVWALQT